MTRLIGFICAEHGYVNVEKTNGLCPYCGKGQEQPQRSSVLIKGCPNTKGRSFFEPAFGKKIHTGDIDILCKEKGLVYGGDDLSREAAKNKQYEETKIKSELNHELKSELSKIIN